MDNEDKTRELEEAEKEWEEKILKPSLEANPERRAKFLTDIGLEIKRIYTPLDVQPMNAGYREDLGFPGHYPFTRGITPTLYRSEPFMIGAYSGFGEAQTCNERYRKLMDWGVDKIVIALDLPTQVGYDSDHIMAKGEVGRAGVAIDTLKDMEILFDGVPLNKMKRVGMLAFSFGPIALSFFIALGEKQGLKPSDYVVELQNDFLEDFVARGTYIFPIPPSIRFATDVVGYCARNLPHWYPLSLQANHFNASGTGSTKATAFALSNGVCYINELLSKGYKIDEIAPLISMFLDERSDFWVAICNFRATRRIWAKIMKERMKAQDPRSMALKIGGHSHGGETLLEPLNNVARITLGTFAYVLGGIQTLTASSYDETLGTPGEEASKIAMRTQQILAHELGITHTVDPLGGSYFIESLTNQIEKEIYDEFLKVEAMGGALAAIEKGYFRAAMTEGANRRQRAFEKGERVSVGVNKYRTESQIPSGAFRIDPSLEQKQVDRLKQVRKERNGHAVKEALEYVREVAKGDGNLVPPILEAVRLYASIGEICGVLREVFGEYQVREKFF